MYGSTSSVHAVIMTRLIVGLNDQELVCFYRLRYSAPSLFWEASKLYLFRCHVTLALPVSADGNGIAVTVITNSISFRRAMQKFSFSIIGSKHAFLYTKTEKIIPA